jgi:MFS family permease
MQNVDARQSAQVSSAQAKDEWPKESYSWYVVLVLCICGMVAFIDRQIINLLVEDIKADLQISDTEVSLLQGFAFAVFYALAAVPLGRLADTSSRRRLITVGIVVWTAAAAACGLAKSFWQLFIARVFVGVGEATLTPSGFSMLADLFRPGRVSLPVAVFTASSFVGSGVALLVGGYVISALSRVDNISLPIIGVLQTWEAAFIICALPGILVALWFHLTVREPVRRASVSSNAIADQSAKPSLHEVWVFVRGHSQVFTAVFAGISVLAAVQFCLGAWVPAHFIRNHGWTPSEVGYAYGLIFLICGTGGAISGGWIADRLQRKGVKDGHLLTAMWAALLAAPFVVVFPAVSQAELAIALLAPVVFFGTMPFGAGPALIPVICPPRMRGLLVAIYLLIANLIGQAGGPLVVALFTDWVFGSPELVSRSLMVAPVALLLIGAVLVGRGRSELRRFYEQAA